MAGASMKEIKLRIKSVESTMQITKAMELVASSKLRRAKERVEKSRPFFSILRETLDDIASRNTDLSSPFTQKRERNRVCYVVIGGDRGLAGGYNSSVFKAALENIGDKEATIMPIGKKTVEYFERRGYDLVTKSYAVAADVSIADCFAMARIIAQDYLNDEFDELHVCYTQFVSMLTQTPQTMKILPISPDDSLSHTGKARELILYEPGSAAVYDAIVPGYVAGIIYSALCEGVASELAARRTAMDSATKNASDMIDDLSLRYNRARQGAITQEITEIVAGAEQ